MTIKEIALEAGVSTAAVSRYFNGGSLSEEKRKKIKKV
ncbi:MAG TPA: LacI family transcriptional regulator, partial [Lachnospiraceae bacterium]|nr:LacI family transcriptional regulator [Lachnospiraceae bacterium]